MRPNRAVSQPIQHKCVRVLDTPPAQRRSSLLRDTYAGEATFKYAPRFGK